MSRGASMAKFLPARKAVVDADSRLNCSITPVSQVTSLVRSLLNDAANNVYTDNVQLPYLNSGYRTLQRKVGNAGGGGFVTDYVLWSSRRSPQRSRAPERKPS